MTLSACWISGATTMATTEAAYPSGVPTANNNPDLPDRDDTVVSPRVAARYHINSWVSVWGDIGAGFRAPTLNELYRQFRVGTVLTLANNQLGRNAWSAANSASRSFRRQTFWCARPISTTGSRTRSRT